MRLSLSLGLCVSLSLGLGEPLQFPPMKLVSLFVISGIGVVGCLTNLAAADGRLSAAPFTPFRDMLAEGRQTQASAWEEKSSLIGANYV